MQSSLEPAPNRPRVKSPRCSGLLLLNRPPQSRRRVPVALVRELLQSVVAMVPELSGNPIAVELLPVLSVSDGKLLSAASRGMAVYAATFIRERRIVLELGLTQKPELFRAVLLHEIFHFVWVRLGNPRRASFTGLLDQEFHAGARGELGESSSVAKAAVRASAQTPDLLLGQLWRHYVCESFCDTAAYLLSGSNAGEERSCLAVRWMNARRAWFAEAPADGWRF